MNTIELLQMLANFAVFPLLSTLWALNTRVSKMEATLEILVKQLRAG